MRLVSLLSLVVLSGCASILEGDSQRIAIESSPSGADCRVNRGGVEIGRVNPTPGEVTVQKTKHDLEVTCTKPGYQPVTFTSRSDFAAPFFGNILLGGPIGMGIDLSTGAYNKYDAVIAMDLESRSARAVNPLPREAVQAEASTTTASTSGSHQAVSASERALTSEHADRYQARREQLRKQKYSQ